MQWEMGAAGKAYSKWTAEMALGLSTGVPWTMCKQDDAPYPIVSFSLPFPPSYLISSLNYSHINLLGCYIFFCLNFGFDDIVINLMLNLVGLSLVTFLFLKCAFYLPISLI